MMTPPKWQTMAVACAFLAAGACHRAAVPPVDDTASDVAALPGPAPAPARSHPSPGRAPVPAPVPAKFKATGTEPFWGAAVDGATLVYTTPEFANGIRITVTRRDSAGSAEYAGTLDGKPLSLKVTPGPCSDGMSERIYRFTAVREIGPDIARGCAD